MDIREVITERNKVSGSKGAEALRQTSLIAQSGSMQPMVRVESKELLSVDPVVLINNALVIATQAYLTIHCNCNGDI
jgi:hypothetical protein